MLMLSLIVACGALPGLSQTANDTQIRLSKDTKIGAKKIGVSDARFARLRRGINTSHWFSQVFSQQGYTREHFTTHTTERDIRLIKAAGFDHIRFSLNPAPMMKDGDGSVLPVAYMRDVDDALDMMLRHNLAVVVDIHPEDDFKKRIQTDEKYLANFTRFWGALAKHLARRDAERVFLEVLNEPTVEDEKRWAQMQARLVQEIRRNAPRHTIIVAGHRWSGLNELRQLEPLPDPNIIYNFHFYDPMDFTHQGANWGSEHWQFLRGVAYPSTPESVVKSLPLVTNEAARSALARYGEARWNPARIEAELAQAAAWGRERNVRVTCNEFGVYRKFAAPSDRAAWLRDVRTSLEKHNIGWTMWDYQGGFSVVNKDGNRTLPDANTVNALGLNYSPQ